MVWLGLCAPDAKIDAKGQPLDASSSFCVCVGPCGCIVYCHIAMMCENMTIMLFPEHCLRVYTIAHMPTLQLC